MTEQPGSMPLIVIGGPTATGKSTLAVEIAQRIGGEIISADSVQVYQKFDIGSGKLTAQEQRGIPHHLINVVDPMAPFSAAMFARMADDHIAQIRKRQRVPIVVGGSGLYVKALLYGLFNAPIPDASIRAKHAEIRRCSGTAELHSQLMTIDAKAAQRINQNDFVRISRALEVYEQTGQTISDWHESHRFAHSRHHAFICTIDVAREALRTQVHSRIDTMLSSGWVEEVEKLRALGYQNAQPMKALGYRQFNAYLADELGLEDAISSTKRDTWRFAKRQHTWFCNQNHVARVSSVDECLQLWYSDAYAQWASV